MLGHKLTLWGEGGGGDLVSSSGGEFVAAGMKMNRRNLKVKV